MEIYHRFFFFFFFFYSTTILLLLLQMHLSSLTDYTASDLASLLGTRLEPSPDPTRPLLPLNFTSSSTGGDGSSSGGGARRSVLPSTLPTYWNWVDQGMVTSVKNQGNVSGGGYGMLTGAKACWC